MELKVIAHIHTDFEDKFGVPRQSGIAPTVGRLVFEPRYRLDDAIKGIEGYSHLWLIWGFSENPEKWSPTVRPPRLGGNKRVGVFATRSPYRPNSLGLSSVELIGTEATDESGTVLLVGGADLVDGTPVFDIKPYLAYTDSHPDAKGGFADEVLSYSLKLDISKPLLNKIPPEHRESLKIILENDPRPSYHSDPTRVYGMKYAGLEIKFTVKNDIISVCSVDTY